MTTDDARAIAERRWIPGTFPAWLRDAFVEGYEAGWAAGRAETTTATTEDAEEVLHGAGWFARAELDPRDLRGILHDLADAGLLRGGSETPTEEWPRCKASRDGGCARCHDEHGRHVPCRAETTTATTEADRLDAVLTAFAEGNGSTATLIDAAADLLSVVRRAETTTATTEDMTTRLAAAEAELDRLCNGGRFTMSIPPREDHDSDLLIQAALSDLRGLLATTRPTDTTKEN